MQLDYNQEKDFSYSAKALGQRTNMLKYWYDGRAIYQRSDGNYFCGQMKQPTLFVYGTGALEAELQSVDSEDVGLWELISFFTELEETFKLFSVVPVSCKISDEKEIQDIVLLLLTKSIYVCVHTQELLPYFTQTNVIYDLEQIKPKTTLETPYVLTKNRLQKEAKEHE